MSGSDSNSSGISTSRDGTIHREKRKRREEEEADREAGEVVDATIDEEPTLPHDDQVTLWTDPTSKNHQKKQKVDEDVFKFEISKFRGKRFSKWLGTGLEDSERKKIRSRYSPSFEKKSNKLQISSLDDCLYLRLMLVKGSSASKRSIDSNERSLYKLQQKVLEVAKPLLFLSNQTRK